MKCCQNNTIGHVCDQKNIWEKKQYIINIYLVLFLQNFRRVVLLIGDVNALQTVNVSWQDCFVDVSFASLDDLNEGVVDEDVLLFSLDQVISLSPDVLQVAEDVDIPSGLNLPQHGIHDNVASGSSNSGTIQ